MKNPLPRLRFPEFQEDWKIAKIGDFVESYKGGAPLTPSDFVPYSDYEVIPKKAISEDMWLKIDIEKPTYCKENFYKENPQSVVDNTYLITTLRDLVPSGPSIGYIVKYKSNKKYILAQGVYGLKPKKTINSDFLIHFSKTGKYRKMMQSVMVGSTQVHIRNSDYLDLPIYVPILAEQQKIADCLTSLDEIITAQSQKVDALQVYKKGLMQNLFPAEGESVPRLRFPEFESAGEWKSVKLKKLTNLITKGTTPTSLGYQFTTSGINFIKIESITEEGVINLSKTALISEECNNALKRSQLKENDILFSIAGALGVVTVVSNNVLPANTNQALAIIRLDSKESLGYISYFLKTQSIQSEIIKIKAGAAQPNISLEQLGNFDILLPELKEQLRIAEFLTMIDKQISAQRETVEMLKSHKRGLMQGLFPSVGGDG